MTDAPGDHVREGQKLTADALVSLYEIVFKNQPVVVRVKNDDTVTWLGQTYEGWPVRITGDKRTAEEELPRPRFQVLNPEGIFSRYALDGDLDFAVVRRKRVLRQHIDDNVNLFQQTQWYVSRVQEVISGQGITLELRHFHDGPTFKLPGRIYMPPEFPVVNLS